MHVCVWVIDSLWHHRCKAVWDWCIFCINDRKELKIGYQNRHNERKQLLGRPYPLQFYTPSLFRKNKNVHSNLLKSGKVCWKKKINGQNFIFLWQYWNLMFKFWFWIFGYLLNLTFIINLSVIFRFMPSHGVSLTSDLMELSHHMSKFLKI